MNRIFNTGYLRSLSPLCALLVLGACNSSANSPPYESETHFLSACVDSCPDDLSCVCGVCTRGCDEDAQCTALSTSATCVSVAQGCGASQEVCDVECTRERDCKDGYECSDGRCRPPQAETTSGSGTGAESTMGASRDASVSGESGASSGSTQGSSTGDEPFTTSEPHATSEMPPDDTTRAGTGADASTACSFELPLFCDCNDDGDCEGGALCYYADCAAELAGGCSMPPDVAGTCWDDRDCSGGTVCSGGTFPTCGRDSVTRLGQCTAASCGASGPCVGGQICVQSDSGADAGPTFECVDNPCFGEALDCGCAAALCAASPGTTCSLPDPSQGDVASDIACLPPQAACVAEAQLGCAETACCDGLQCCQGVPYDARGECLVECLAISDQNQKTNIESLDPSEVLRQVSELPLARWSYRSSPRTPHLGPMAQDFKAAFGVGDDDRVIHSVDGIGVALAAIQALSTQVDELGRELHRLNAELETTRQQCKPE